MCMSGGGDYKTPAQTPAAAPVQTPVLTSAAGDNTSNTASAYTAATKGRKSLRIDLASSNQSSPTGLNLPT